MEIVTLHGVKMPLNPTVMRPRIQEIMRKGNYEKPEVTALKAILRPGDRVMDLGAGFGLTSTYAALQPGIASVTTFEANPGILDHIAEVHRLNGARVEIRHGVLEADAKGGTRPFYVGEFVWGSSLFPDNVHGAKRVEIAVIDLAEALASTDPTVICCDIEGGEYDVLMRADLSRVRALVIELHPKIIGQDKTDEIEAMLRAAGFAKQPALESDATVVYTRARKGLARLWPFSRG